VRINLISEKTCHDWKERATFDGQTPEASHWKNHVTMEL